MNPQLFKKKHIDRLGVQYKNFENIFHPLKDIYFFCKNLESQIFLGNPAFIQMCGKKDELDVIGKSDYDFFPQHLVQGYILDDQKVISTNKTMQNKIELVSDLKESLKWFITTKAPLYDKRGKIMGTMGTTRDMQITAEQIRPFEKMSKAIEHIHDNYANPIEIKNIAKEVHLSVSQFERNFKKVFKTSPLKYIQKVRLDIAIQKIIDTNRSISEIALESGFYDHSHFCHYFKKQTELSPLNYRKKLHKIHRFNK
ncbi:MAG: hypothetical protein COA79_10615 [Planctomycetota bacterium]|nr:MAG: hypothetical protein COA79_10615 [Planctomycetota bacterium]